VDSGGTARFVGSAEAVVDMNRWTADFRYNLDRGGQLHGYVGQQRVRALEPASQGNSIPGFGHNSRSVRGLLTLEGQHSVGANTVNEARFGISSLDGGIRPAAQLNPLELGIQNGVDRAIGLPQMIVAGGLNFGGPSNYPQGREDHLYVVTDTATALRGRHTVRLGGEYRMFLNNNFAQGTGTLNFPSLSDFLSGTANAFTITLGERRNYVRQDAIALFVQDRMAIGSRVSLDIGMRYEWHVTPTERNDSFVVFDAERVSLLRVGVDTPRIYDQNNTNVEPRIGLAWDLSTDGRTVIRMAYGLAVDQPGTTVVRDTASNPPYATPLAAAGAISLGSAIVATQAVALAPVTVDPQFRNSSLHAWNVNIQRQLGSDFAAMVGYFGSRGQNLRIGRNLNQPIDGVRPFTALSADSPILPGTMLSNIMQNESTGFSSYRALWVSATKRLSRGVQFDTSYTWSRSRDTNSLNSSGYAVQDSYNIAGQYGRSDFDAPHRFIVSGSYDLPFPDHPLLSGWQLAAIVQSQSGNPVNIVTSTSTLTGTPNTVRPDLVGPIRIIGSVDQWFDTSAFVAVNRFGNLGRNVVTGPGYHNTDMSIVKHARVGTRAQVQFRVDIFDVFNRVNFGPPGNVVGTPTFGKITRTRFSTGEGGSSRQIQLAVKFAY
jgi:hypothetical protein